jgi:hypothetical protein
MANADPAIINFFKEVMIPLGSFNLLTDNNFDTLLTDWRDSAQQPNLQKMGANTCSVMVQILPQKKIEEKQEQATVSESTEKAAPASTSTVNNQPTTTTSTATTTTKNPAGQLPKFQPRDYYSLTTDVRVIQGDNKAISPHQLGRELIAEYYAKKYNTEIIFPAKVFEEDKIFLDVVSFSVYINAYLDPFRNEENKDCRVCFFIGGGSTHAIPIIYIRENGKEGILYADSKGVNSCVAENIVKATKIPVYAIEDSRQADKYSCYTEALAFNRDATAKDKETEEYRIPQLLSYLEKNSAPSEQGQFHKVTKLPNALLKTSQKTGFVEKYADTTDLKKVIHKGKALSKFREEYTDKNVSVKRENNQIESKDISNYLSKKGIKFSDIIEIQFYTNHLKKELGNIWSDKTRGDFILGAKKVFHSQPTVHQGREGLYQFAEAFLFVQRKSLSRVKSQSNVQPKPATNKATSIFDSGMFMSGIAMLIIGVVLMIFQPHLGLLGFLLIEAGCSLATVGGWGLLNEDKISERIDDGINSWGETKIGSVTQNKSNPGQFRSPTPRDANHSSLQSESEKEPSVFGNVGYQS